MKKVRVVLFGEPYDVDILKFGGATADDLQDLKNEGIITPVSESPVAGPTRSVTVDDQDESDDDARPDSYPATLILDETLALTVVTGADREIINIPGDHIRRLRLASSVDSIGIEAGDILEISVTITKIKGSNRGQWNTE